MIKDGKKVGKVVCKLEGNQFKRIGIPFDSEILDLLDQVVYTNIMDVFHTIQKEVWKSLNMLEQQNYIQFLFNPDGRLDVKKLIN